MILYGQSSHQRHFARFLSRPNGARLKCDNLHKGRLSKVETVKNQETVGDHCVGALIPSNFVRFNNSALTATNSDEPDIEIAAIAGLSTSPNDG